MNSLDFELKLLEGSPIYIHPNMNLHSISLHEMNEIRFTIYNSVINLLCIDIDTVNSIFPDKNISVFDFIMLYIKQIKYQQDEEYDNIIHVLEKLFGCSVCFNFDLNAIYIGEYGVLYADNFDEFQSTLKARNCLEHLEEEKDNPSNEMARRLLEKRKKARQKLKNQNKDEEDINISLADLISIFSESNHMSFYDIFRSYDMYQFNDQFKRMQIVRDYNVNIQALLAGAKSDDIKLQHWLCKLKLNN